MNYSFKVTPDIHSVYIHWPFCPYKCHFCPFVALAGHDQFMERYHKALIKEIEMFQQKSLGKSRLDTVFIGGGTPSTYPCELLLDTFGILREVFDFSSTGEVTIEVNPGTVKKKQVAIWKKLGITRLSIGVQSLNDTVLKNLNRHQTAQEVYQVLADASEHFDNMSVDLILGLPQVSDLEWKTLLEKAVTWPIKHISVYFLTVHEDTPLYFGVKKQKVTLPCDDEIVDLFYWTVDFLINNGFEHYEISNFAKPGYQSVHNSMYWDRKPYKAFGIGACEFDGESRFQNEKNLIKYLEKVERGELPTVFAENLSQEQIYLEKIMLGLRRSKGVDVAELFDHLKIDQRKKISEMVILLKQNDFLTEKNGRLLLTPKGLAVENDIVTKLSI